MNLKNLFNNRNKNFVRLSEAGDYLSRSLRENLAVYEIDDANKKVTYITEGNILISCDYKEIKGKLTFENFVTENLDRIISDDHVDSLVGTSVQKFVTSIARNRFDKAEASFDSVLDAFSMRAKIEESRKKLHKRSERFGDVYNIKETKSYKKFKEALPLLKHFFETNREELSKNRKLIEGLRLSKVVGETYDLPKVTIESLKDEFIVVPSNTKRTLYEMVCEKELIRKELLEAKESFHRVWASNDAISALASHIYSKNGTVKRALHETIQEIPYMALANKVDLVALMESVFQITNPGTVSQKDIKEFVNKLYEFKKPLKSQVIEHLNETYGINVQSLKFIPSFKGLAEVQSEVFAVLSESMEEGILCDVTKEFSQAMQKKGGVQVLDVANTLSTVMNEAQFTVVDIQENFDMKKLSDYLSDDINEAQYYGDDDELSNSGGNADGDDDDKGKKKKKKKKKKDKADEEGDVDDDENDPTGDQEELDSDKDGDIDAKDLKKLRKNKKKKLRKEGTDVAEQEEEAAEAEEEIQDGDEDAAAEEADAERAADAEAESRDKDYIDLVSDIEKAIKDIDFDLEDDDDVDDDVDTEEEVEA